VTRALSLDPPRLGGVAGECCRAFGFDLAGPFGDGLGSPRASRVAWVSGAWPSPWPVAEYRLTADRRAELTTLTKDIAADLRAQLSHYA
jgi:hypothetical protein